MGARKQNTVVGEQLPEELCKAMVKKLLSLDSLKEMGEEPYEIESEVSSTARSLAATFFGWLLNHGVSGSIEVLAGMSQHFIEFVYLTIETRRGTLSKLSKAQLREFVCLCEFAVPEEEWNSFINPFDGLRLFFEFLDDIGYPAKRNSMARALQEFRKSILKHPVHHSLSHSLSEVQ